MIATKTTTPSITTTTPSNAASFTATSATSFTATTETGSGCGSFGRAVDSDSRGPWFESSHRQKFIYIEHLFPVNCALKRRK